MNRICIAALMTVMICGSGCEPSKQEVATEKLLSASGLEMELWSLEPGKYGCPGADYIRDLISDGADVNGKDRRGRTPLISAVRFSSPPQIVTLLIEAGADVNAKDDDGETPLMMAYSPEKITLLIEAGADVNAKDDEGQTPLMYADRSPESLPSPTRWWLPGVRNVHRFSSTPPEIIRESIQILKDAGAKE